MLIDNTALRAFTALGVPGAGLLLIYVVANWLRPGSLVISEGWTAPSALAMVLSAAIILYRIVSPVPPPTASNPGPVSISLPHAASFQQMADTLAGTSRVEYLGFTPTELDARLAPRHVQGVDTAAALENLGIAARLQVRPFTVETPMPGRIVLRVKDA
ncbi:MAG: hypothetical protein ABWY06_23135 [Pseudomonas sp.]|uniref:hypothetical protein n=1 Tax=Pseudomonas sp. TaxID=306 RepID=UPI00339ADF28